MKRLLLFLLSITIATACTTESYETVDPSEFNTQIANRRNIQNIDQLIKIYFIKPNAERQEGVTISVDTYKIGENKFSAVLIQNGSGGDSIGGIKVVMTAEKNGDTWTVTDLKRNFKCWEGRGHTSWGTEPCI